MNLDHRVIAVMGGEVKKVHCLTCSSDHKYYPPKGTRTAEPTIKPTKVSPTGRSSPVVGNKTTAKAFSEWSTFMKEMPPDADPRPYRITDFYEASEFIEHPSFGTGRVLQVLGREKIEVVFKDGRKVLIFNKKRG